MSGASDDTKLLNSLESLLNESTEHELTIAIRRDGRTWISSESAAGCDQASISGTDLRNALGRVNGHVEDEFGCLAHSIIGCAQCGAVISGDVR